MDKILQWHPTYEETYRRFGAMLIDATRPLSDVVDEILRRVELVSATSATQAGPPRASSGAFVPTVSKEDAERIRVWHQRAYREGGGRSTEPFDYLGLTIVVPPEVQPITPMSHLLGEAVLGEVRPGERVLDMGTGSGVNAVLAASKGARVIAVDINPHAIDAARDNARRNEVSHLIDVRHSDVFSAVDEPFDLIVFDPPFRWFRPRDLREAATTDENYRAMTTFFRKARQHLRPDGRMLISFGTSGDLGYLKQLLDEEGFRYEEVAHAALVRDGWQVDYFTFRCSSGFEEELGPTGP